VNRSLGKIVIALGPALTSSRWRMVFWFSIDRTLMARFIVHLTLPNVAALKLMVLEGIEAFVLTQTSSSEDSLSLQIDL